MESVYKFLKENPTFFLATLEGNEPRVRPLGFSMIHDGRLCFCTNRKKDMFRQMQANPQVEICGMSNDGRWMRVKGSVVFDTTREAKEAALNHTPFLRNMYSEDDGIFEIFGLEHGVATFCGVGEEPQTIAF